MNIDLTLPKAKHFTTKNVKTNPFPINNIVTDPVHHQFQGIFTGMSVEVFDPADINELYMNGSYGISSHTKVKPKLLAPIKKTECISAFQFENKLDWQKKLNNVNPTKVPIKIVSNDSTTLELPSESELNCLQKIDPFPLEESLVLALEEAFFLHHTLKCLNIFSFDQTKELNTDEFLDICCKLKKNFLLYYIGYHYYRSKNWVVKSGLKFGGDYLLYYKGPQFYHASYVVIVKDSDDDIDALDMQSNYRVAETANKDVIILDVKRPSGMGYDSPEQCIEHLKEFTVMEIIPKRFQLNESGKETPHSSQSWKRLKISES